MRLKRGTTLGGRHRAPEVGSSPTRERKNRMSGKNGATIRELSRKDIAERLERGAQHRLKMSAEEMVRAYRKGKLEDPGVVGDLLILASLLPEGDRLFVRA